LPSLQFQVEANKRSVEFVLWVELVSLLTLCEQSFIKTNKLQNRATRFVASSFHRITDSFQGDPPMHKIVAAAAVLGLLGLPILASAQNTNQPSSKKESAANAGNATKKATKANATNKAAKKSSMNRQAQVSKKRRLALHGHKMRHATAKHGKRLAKSHSSIQRQAAYRAQSAPTTSCGEFMYRKGGKCNDARNKPAK